MTYKCYEYMSAEGKKRTEWFKWTSDNRDPWQLKNKLRNFYKDNE